MLRFIHFLLLAVYFTLPALALARALRARRRGRPLPLLSLTFSLIFSFVLALAVCVFYARVVKGGIRVDQVFIATYFAAAMLLLLKLFDAGLSSAAQWLMRVSPRADSQPFPFHRDRLFGAALIRVVILFGVGLPYVIAVGMIYRPKVAPLDDPQTQLGFPFQRVQFISTDGTKLVGWWIPAMGNGDAANRWNEFGDNTVVVCHGLGASKSNQLILARRLVPGGFNVLAFDFRAHGESGGQITTFGDHERRDVLGAVRWLRSAHPAESRKIYGVGASLGAVALISAAADDSDEGRAISAIAAYAGYDRLGELSRSVSQHYLLPPLDWWLAHVCVPMASAQSGVDLAAYAPADDVAALWPRPILFIHGEQDQIVDFARGKALFESASQPKYHLWFPQGDHNDVVSDESAANVVLEFFKTAAEPVPII